MAGQFLVLARDGCPPGCVDGETQRHNSTQTGKTACVQATALSPSPFESTKVDRHANPFVNDAKVNLAARRSVDAWRIRRRSRREEKGARRGGWGRWKGKKGKRMPGGAAIKVAAPERVGNGALAVLGGWGEEPGRFSLVASGHDDGPTHGWTGTSGHRPEEDDQGPDRRMDGETWELKMDHSNNRQRDATGQG